MPITIPPPYNYLEHFICNIDDVRHMVMRVPITDISDDEVKRIAYETYSDIRTITDKDDWGPTDREFGVMALINVELTVAVLWQYFGRTPEYREMGKSLYESVHSHLETVTDNMDTTTGEEQFVITRTISKGWNTNPEVPVPRSNLTIV